MAPQFLKPASRVPGRPVGSAVRSAFGTRLFSPPGHEQAWKREAAAPGESAIGPQPQLLPLCATREFQPRLARAPRGARGTMGQRHYSLYTAYESSREADSLGFLTGKNLKNEALRRDTIDVCDEEIKTGGIAESGSELPYGKQNWLQVQGSFDNIIQSDEASKQQCGLGVKRAATTAWPRDNAGGDPEAQRSIGSVVGGSLPEQSKQQLQQDRGEVRRDAEGGSGLPCAPEEGEEHQNEEGSRSAVIRSRSLRWYLWVAGELLCDWEQDWQGWCADGETRMNFDIPSSCSCNQLDARCLLDPPPADQDSYGERDPRLLVLEDPLRRLPSLSIT
ncbi:hypothetical protein NDU88_011531 [Pleurodeles waltl]|uniref:Uncharacterized protein n=1 Tax=Pleurodeles waltl TaxID=8319 RepID=A0AAV7R192_PLEWA|nr:hypothetical protein NDU88_011531 [Pleurodeles waltl]